MIGMGHVEAMGGWGAIILRVIVISSPLQHAIQVSLRGYP